MYRLLKLYKITNKDDDRSFQVLPTDNAPELFTFDGADPVYFRQATPQEIVDWMTRKILGKAKHHEIEHNSDEYDISAYATMSGHDWDRLNLNPAYIPIHEELFTALPRGVVEDYHNCKLTNTNISHYGGAASQVMFVDQSNKFARGLRRQYPIVFTIAYLNYLSVDNEYDAQWDTIEGKISLHFKTHRPFVTELPPLKVLAEVKTFHDDKVKTVVLDAVERGEAKVYYGGYMPKEDGKGKWDTREIWVYIDDHFDGGEYNLVSNLRYNSDIGLHTK